MGKESQSSINEHDCSKHQTFLADSPKCFVEMSQNKKALTDQAREVIIDLLRKSAQNKKQNKK
jgi:hypothetical protein